MKTIDAGVARVKVALQLIENEQCQWLCGKMRRTAREAV